MRLLQYSIRISANITRPKIICSNGIENRKCIFFFSYRKKRKRKNVILIIWRQHNTLHIMAACLNLQRLGVLIKTERNQTKWGHKLLIICWLISSPDCWTLACEVHVPFLGYAPLTGLDQFWCQWRHIIFRNVTSTWKPCFPGMLHFSY